MIQLLTIFGLAAAGSVIATSIHYLLSLIARRAARHTFPTGWADEPPADAGAEVDPAATVGFIAGCYGALALTLIGTLPGPHALDRTALAFALLCAGGLIGAIASTGHATPPPTLDADEVTLHEPRPMSRRLSVALAITLNAAFAVLSYAQELIDIVPPHASSVVAPAVNALPRDR